MRSYERGRRVTPSEQRGAPTEPGARETPFRLRAESTADTKLAQIAKRAQDDPKLKFTTVMHHFSAANLEQCYRELEGNKALGVDGISKAEYGRELDRNVDGLVERLKRFSYRPQAVRRVLIPKGDGKMRPLGISCVEDKLVQRMAAKILEAIYEQDFLDCSYGFRPARGCHVVVRDAYQHLYRNRVKWVVDIDIQAYFDTIDHDWLMRCLQERIADQKFLRLIQRMLKAGVLTEGEFSKTDEGTPQGSIVSPVLSNIYLHYILDLWFEKVVRKQMRGKASLWRYADDSIALFEDGDDAREFIEMLQERFGKFGLRLHPTKTKIVRFDREEKQSGTFDFLGFTFYYGKSRKGNRVVKLRTSKERLRVKLKQFKEWLKANRNCFRLPQLWETAKLKLLGHINYYGVSWNSRSLSWFCWNCTRLLFKWLNRRSQRRSFNWLGFQQRLRQFPLPQPRIRVVLFAVPAYR